MRNYLYYSDGARIPDARGRIELQVPDTSIYFLPSEAFVEIEGQLLKANHIAYGIGDQIGIVNNGVMALFSNATYMIDGKEIKSCLEDVDVATTIIGLARYSNDYSRSAGLSVMFAMDTADDPEIRNMTKNAIGTEVA